MRRILPVVGVVVLVLVLAFVVLGSCSGSSAADKYRSYVTDVNAVARESNTDAKALDAALYNQELTPDQVITKVASFIPKARATETTASTLKPPSKIKQQDLQRFLLQALQYRTLALNDLSNALKIALLGKKADVPATPQQRELVAGAYSELIASDVVFAASFQRPAQEILKEANVTDAAIISSPWALSPELANPDANGNGLWIQSVRDAGSVKPCTGGTIGTSIDGVTANGKALVAGSTVTTVKLTIPSTFKVTVGNHGNCPVRGIEIRLTEGGSKTQVEKVKSLLPSESVDKSFPATGNPGEVKVDVTVPTVGGESNADNNHYTYHVVFQSA
jgi:Tfp pilus assembly protein PilP